MNNEDQNKFRLLTSETNEFSSCFQNELPVLKQFEDWKNTLNRYIRKAFKKVRIKKRSKILDVNSKLQFYMNLRNQLTRSNTKSQQANIEKVDLAISNLEAKMNYEKIKKNFKSFSEDPERVNLQEIWKTMNKLWPKVENKLPAAKKNNRGQIISDPNELKKLLEQEYR